MKKKSKSVIRLKYIELIAFVETGFPPSASSWGTHGS